MIRQILLNVFRTYRIIAYLNHTSNNEPFILFDWNSHISKILYLK